MEVAHLIPYIGRAQGGPVYALATVSACQASMDCTVRIFSTVLDTDGEHMAFDQKVEVVKVKGTHCGGLRRSPGLWRKVEDYAPDIIHSHSVWTDVNRLAASLSRRRKLPHLIGPCGALSSSAIRHHGWKKWPARFWFADRALREANCLLANSDSECEDIRKYGLVNPVAVVANPVSGFSKPAISREDFCQRYGLDRDKRYLLYLGRLHPVKGLERLLEAWAALRRFQSEWCLILAGPDEGGYRSTLEQKIQSLGCQDTVSFTGPLNDKAKWGAYAAASLFVMPSDFENFGIAIAEALIMGVPVITTTGTPWNSLAVSKAGWWVTPDSTALARALEEAMTLGPDKRQEMTDSAKRMGQQFEPTSIVRQLMDVYLWLLGRAAKPACVGID